ncbi:conserved hypothetical protein [Histoplasma mississippiense (nom. inval.)]|uniref:conserved hypothetical protein n=1 Tax=Ajellomyces capsulatus (strain NAm1 / WU24) TaxID=2059318 RepID=UPI000157C678|nr:conserved hypothetical protein [Histoplasma mississippiense (nom. inval.)]EDN08820.1 conserved hypothetical protein [Histoplasma mississippiense (nom. inval.)]
MALPTLRLTFNYWRRGGYSVGSEDYRWAITGIGSLCYVALFQGSTYLTEKITASKYPDYKQYQLRVGKFIPRLGVEARGEIPEDNALSASVSASEDPNQPHKPQLSKTKTTKKSSTHNS